MFLGSSVAVRIANICYIINHIFDDLDSQTHDESRSGIKGISACYLSDHARRERDADP